MLFPTPSPPASCTLFSSKSSTVLYFMHSAQTIRQRLLPLAIVAPTAAFLTVAKAPPQPPCLLHRFFLVTSS